MSNKIFNVGSKSRKFENRWQNKLADAIADMFQDPHIGSSINESHHLGTPDRVAKAMIECFSGCYKDPASVLSTLFPSEGSEMIFVSNVRFISYCAHHLMPFSGSYTFSYIPDEHIVGLSKIPRMVQIFAARPQVQEKLSNDIVSLFQEVVKPRGCAVTIDAEHYCMCSRGVKEYAITRTTALAGIFKYPDVKSEYLATIGPLKGEK
jgi:GTP cyclohydrolase I